MQCPADKIDLVMTERQGIEIDYCPKCRGVWLDRGELDKIIERASGPAGQAPAYQPQQYQKPQEYQQQPVPHRKKRESLLGELFDF